MEIATAIVPLILQPAIEILLKKFLETSSGIDAHEHDLQTLSFKVLVLKQLVRQALEGVYSSTGVLSVTLPETVKQWLEKWVDVIEDAETTIAECRNGGQSSTCCLPAYRNIRRIKQITKRIKAMHNEAQSLLIFYLVHMQTSGQNGFHPASNALTWRRSQMMLACPTPQVRRLQDTASTVTVRRGLNGQIILRGIDTYATDFALVADPRNPPISVIVNCEEGDGNPRSVLLQNVDDAEETAIQICQEGILVTTNSRRIQEIEALSEEERWEVFRFHVFSDSYRQHLYSHEMEEMSRAIFRSIARMPYLVEPVAHILAKVKNPFYWQLKAALFRPPPERLYDRYNALPSFVQLCFLSCAAFPKDEEIDAEILVEVWIAEGLLPIKHELIELVAFGYQVMKLLLRYRLIEVSDYDWAGRPVHCMLPDRVHYMAAEILREDKRCFFRPREDLDQFSWPESPVCRSISIISNNIRFLPKRSGSESVRSLLLASNLSLQNVPCRFLKGLTSLRVLDLSNTGIVSLPSSLGGLKRLVYLNLSSTKIQRLPKYVSRLKKLQSLILSSCLQLEFLPAEICQLQCLMHLDVSGCTALKFLPCGITKLEALQILKTNATQVWKPRSKHLQMLGEFFSKRQRKIACLNDLKVFKNLKRLHLDSEEEALIPEGVMASKKKMQILWLRMTKLENLPQDMTAMTDLGELQLWKCMRLQELPDGVCELCDLRYLCLNRCYSLRSLPCLERMPLLRSLQIEFCESLMELPSDFGRDGAFPALQSFVLVGMKIRMLPRIERGAMPQLKHMALKSCKNLNRLPAGLEFAENLQTLDITDSDLLMDSMRMPSNPSEFSRALQIIPSITQ